MPHVMKMKDGKLFTPFDLKDVLEAVEEYAGEEPRRYIEEYLEDNIQEACDFEAQAEEYEKQMERDTDHHRQVLCNIREEVEALDQLLHESRLNRKRMQGAVKILHQMVSREL